MRRHALSAVIAASCAAFPACQAGVPTPSPAVKTPLLSQNFDAGAGPFDVYDYDTVRSEVRDGALHLLFTEAGDISNEQAYQQFGDVSVQVDATDIGPQAAARYGVFCRLPDEGIYYQLFIDSSGQAGTRSSGYLVQGGTPLVMTPNAAVRPGLGVANRIRADCVGPTFTLWVNDQLVGAMSDTTTATGDVGFFASSAADGQTDVAFDNFAVFNP